MSPLSTRRTPYGASRLVHAMSDWWVKTRRVPSRESGDVRIYGHTTTAMHGNSAIVRPLPRALSISLCVSLCLRLCPTGDDLIRICFFLTNITGKKKRMLTKLSRFLTRFFEILKGHVFDATIHSFFFPGPDSILTFTFIEKNVLKTDSKSRWFLTKRHNDLRKKESLYFCHYSLFFLCSLGTAPTPPLPHRQSTRTSETISSSWQR